MLSEVHSLLAGGSLGPWMKFNDELVSSDIPWKEVASSRGLLYLYNRRQPRQQPILTPSNYTAVFTEHPAPPAKSSSPCAQDPLPQDQPPLPCPSSSAPCLGPEGSPPPSPQVQQPAVSTSSADDTDSEAEDFEVEEIVDHRPKGEGRTNRKVEYRVKWVGYGPKNNTWEPFENLEGAPDALNDYWAKIDPPRASASPSSLAPPEDPPANPAASQLRAHPPPPTTTHSANPKHPCSPPPPAAAMPTNPAVAAAAPSSCAPLSATGLVPHPPAPLHPKPTTTGSSSRRPAASSSAGRVPLQAAPAPTNRRRRKPTAASSVTAMRPPQASGAGPCTQGPVTKAAAKSASVALRPPPPLAASVEGCSSKQAAHHYQHGSKPSRVAAGHSAVNCHGPPRPTVSSPRSVEKLTTKSTRSNPSVEAFSDSSPLGKVASRLLQERHHQGRAPCKHFLQCLATPHSSSRMSFQSDANCLMTLS